MTAPVGRLKKKEIVWLANHRCRHGHNFLEHWSCFEKEVVEKGVPFQSPNDNIPIPARIGIFDIETSNLKANFGIIYCYCILDLESNKILERLITPKEIKSEVMDREVVKQCVEDLQKFDRIVGYYSTRFDLPFIRTRATIHGIEFPGYASLLHTDIYYPVRNKFCLHSNRLGTASEVLTGESNKTHFGPPWVRAMTGHQKSLDYILDHCRKDVIDTGRTYKTVIKYTMRTDRSI